MSWRACITGLVFVAGLSLLVPYNDLVLGNTHLMGTYVPLGPFFLLVVLTLAGNLFLKLLRWRPFRQAELLLVWCMMIAAATVPGGGWMRTFFPLVAGAPYYARRPDLRWEEEGHALAVAPRALVLAKDLDAESVTGFFRGTQNAIPWTRWARPLLSWGILILLFYLGTLFLCSLLRRRWVDQEHLSFPLARVPIELTESGEDSELLPPLVKNRYFLAGSVVSILFGTYRLFLIQGPAFLPLGQLFQGTFLEGADFGGAFLFPIIVGFAFLIPTRVAFSLWFFRLFFHGEMLTASRVGFRLSGGGAPFMGWQQAGSFIAFGLLLLWSARRQLSEAARRAIGWRDEGIDDSDEPVSYRLAVWGLIVCLAGMLGWYRYMGMGLGVGVQMLALIWIVVIIDARLVAQGGLIFTGMWWSPIDLVAGLNGSMALTGPAVVAAQMQQSVMLSGPRPLLGPHAMNAFRLSTRIKKRRRLFLPVLLAAIIVSTLVAGWASMHTFYGYGASNLSRGATYKLPRNTFQSAERLLLGASTPVQSSYWGLGLGAGMMGLLVALRGLFHWWFLHPLGFLMANTWILGALWFSFMLGWLVKVTVTRLAGGRGLRRARRFFFGVITTEVLLVALCTLFGLLTGESVGIFTFLPL
jgi:hypothetical protein